MTYALVISMVTLGALFAVKYSHFPPQIPLFYSHSQGEDQLGEWWMIFLLPIMLILFYTLNNYLYRKFFNNISFVQKMIMYLNIFLILGYSFLFIKIVFLIS